jgi:DNA-3-methyladenine glycosylase
MRINEDFFEARASKVAPKLIGLKLCSCDGCEALITEVEAYEGKNDSASHAYKITPRSKIMLDTYAHWYVYFVYGNHYCLNITCGEKEAGACLIREAIPLKGIEVMQRRRQAKSIKELCNGPGKLCEAFLINKTFNGTKLGEKLWLKKPTKKELTLLDKFSLNTLPRIGITSAKTKKWRFKLS